MSLSSGDFIKIPITEDMIITATSIANSIPKSKNVWMPFKRLVDGFIGEQLFCAQFPEAVQSKGDNVYQYDYILAGTKWEIKSKTRPTQPQMYYEGSVYGYHPDQRSDYLAFVQVMADRSCGYLIGYTTREFFDDQREFIKKGTSQTNGLVTKTDTWNIRYSQLRPLQEVREGLS